MPRGKPHPIYAKPKITTVSEGFTIKQQVQLRTIVREEVEMVFKHLLEVLVEVERAQTKLKRAHESTSRKRA